LHNAFCLYGVLLKAQRYNQLQTLAIGNELEIFIFFNKSIVGLKKACTFAGCFLISSI